MEELTPIYKDEFINSLVSFIANSQFQALFENFFLTYALEFDENDEHKLRYYELYKEFQGLFEHKLEEFCQDQQLSSSQFITYCREATANDPKAGKYVDILLSSADYETFVRLMKIMRPIALSRAMASPKADGKSLKNNQVTLSSKHDSDSSNKLSKTWSEEDDEKESLSAHARNKFDEGLDMSDAKASPVDRTLSPTMKQSAK